VNRAFAFRISQKLHVFCKALANRQRTELKSENKCAYLPKAHVTTLIAVQNSAPEHLQSIKKDTIEVKYLYKSTRKSGYSLKFLVLIMGLYMMGLASCKQSTNQVTPKNAAESPTKQMAESEAEPVKKADFQFDDMQADEQTKNRTIWQKPDLVINQLGDLSNKTVADIGAGTGYFAFRLVPKAQKVIAIDINKQFITFMDSVSMRLSEQIRGRFEPRHTTPDDPSLQPEEADVVLLVDTYGYIKNRNQYLARLKKGMKKGGEILIIDFKKENLPSDLSASYTIGISSVVQELESAGFRIAKVDNVALDYQYIIQAKKP
jgi:ubiquinone/menaquinone biosynthesis C-methylase UbiE